MTLGGGNPLAHTANGIFSLNPPSFFDEHCRLPIAVHWHKQNYVYSISNCLLFGLAYSRVAIQMCVDTTQYTSANTLRGWWTSVSRINFHIRTSTLSTHSIFRVLVILQSIEGGGRDCLPFAFIIITTNHQPFTKACHCVAA